MTSRMPTASAAPAPTPGGACEQRLRKATSIGALYEALDERLLDELLGAEISLAKT